MVKQIMRGGTGDVLKMFVSSPGCQINTEQAREKSWEDEFVDCSDFVTKKTSRTSSRQWKKSITTAAAAETMLTCWRQENDLLRSTQVRTRVKAKGTHACCCAATLNTEPFCSEAPSHTPDPSLSHRARTSSFLLLFTFHTHAHVTKRNETNTSKYITCTAARRATKSHKERNDNDDRMITTSYHASNRDGQKEKP